MADFLEKPTTDQEARLLQDREIALAKSIVGSISWAPAANASPSREAPMSYHIQVSSGRYSS